MMRQTEIPKVTIGEPITAALLNQLANGNAARMVTGDGTIDVTQISGMLGLSDPRPQVVGDRTVLVQVSATPVVVKLTNAGASSRTIAGMYKGTIYLDPIFCPTLTEFPSNVSGITKPSPTLTGTNCYVLNENEIGVRTNSVSVSTTTLGKIVGVFMGLPLVWVRVNQSISGLFHFAASTNITTGVSLAGGVYAGRMGTPLTADIVVTGSTFSLSTLVSDPGTNNAYFFNLPEQGQTTHDLLSTANTATLVSVINVGVSSGYSVYAGTLVFPGCS